MTLLKPIPLPATLGKMWLCRRCFDYKDPFEAFWHSEDICNECWREAQCLARMERD